MTLAARAGSLLASHWWRPQPSALANMLRPLSWLYRALALWHKRRAVPQQLSVPVLVVGNCVAGGAGKTPTVIALVQALLAAGRKPGVISRGYGRQGDSVRAVQAGDAAAAVGDEPLLIRRRTGVPVWVGRDRVAAGRALIARNADVDVIVCDDGLQHHRLAWNAAVMVFDERGSGNGLLLPAGPLREALPTHLAPGMYVLYTSGAPSTALPGAVAQRRFGRVRALAGGAEVDISQLRGRPLLAVAGLAAPEKFFAMLVATGLSFKRLPLPDHHAYDTLPWPAETSDVITTEKDAVKLAPQRVGATRIWVVPLDLQLPAALVVDLIRALAPLPAASTP